jgi:hypothetical protein
MRHVVALSLLLVGCAVQPPVEEKVEAPPPVVTPPAPRAPRPVVIQTTWNFDAGTDGCVAVASSGRTSLHVAVRRNASIQMTVSLARSLPPGKPTSIALRFNGPAGRWQVNARRVDSRQLSAELGTDDTALSRVLVLLSGGVLEVGDPNQAIPGLGLAPSEARGRVWFDCARENMT